MTSADLFKANVQRVLAENVARRLEPASRAELARRLGVTAAQVSNVLGPSGAPSLDTLDRFASALGVPAWELLRPADARGDHDIDECLRRVSHYVDVGKKFAGTVKKS